jgi:uncharacterized membrane protein YhaH (DUF805 family)
VQLTTAQILFSFDGRIGRQTWWLSVIALWLVAAAIGSLFLFAAVIPFAAVDEGEELTGAATAVVFAGIIVLSSLGIASTWISFALGAKRLHDQDQSGWLQALSFIPVVGWIASLVLLVMMGFIAGTPGPNRHGPGPGMASGGQGYLGATQYNPYNPYAPGGPQQPTRGAWVNPPLGAPGAVPQQQQPSHPPNVPFQEGGEWRSYNNAGQLLRWDAAANQWVPV